MDRLNESPENVEDGKSKSPKVIYYTISIHIEFLKWQNSGNGEQLSNCQV